MAGNRIAKTGGLTERNDRREEIWEVLRTLVLGKIDAGELLELYYWSQDPEILAMLRTLVMMPEAERKTVCAFFSRTKPQSISVEADAEGRIILSSVENDRRKNFR